MLTDRTNLTEDENSFVVSIILELAGWDPVSFYTPDDGSPVHLTRTSANTNQGGRKTKKRIHRKRASRRVKY